MNRRRASIPGVDQAERRRRLQAYRTRDRPRAPSPQLDLFPDLDPKRKSPADAGLKAD
jgi:hypothetical protein